MPEIRQNVNDNMIVVSVTQRKACKERRKERRYSAQKNGLAHAHTQQLQLQQQQQQQTQTQTQQQQTQ